MNSIQKILIVSKKQPLGCLFAMLLSIGLIGGSILGLIFVVYSIWSVSLVKDAITARTGFSVSSNNIYVNVFTGRCEINNLIITNPEVYDMRELSQRNAEHSIKFLEARNVEMTLNPSALIRGEFEVSSFSADITSLNCVRLNNSTYNLPEFLQNMLQSVSAVRDGGKPTLENFSLKIAKASYTDYSTSKDTIAWQMKMDFRFEQSNVADFKKLVSQLRESFEKANAPFISNGLGFLSNDLSLK